MAYQIFISYRRDGGEALAYLLNEKLKSAGYKVFYDLDSLASGKFNTKLLEVIEACNDILVVLSPKSLERCVNDGDWLRLEVAHALEKGKNIVPVMTRGFEWPDIMPADIKDLKNYNGVTVNFEFFEGVLAKIAKCLTTSSTELKLVNNKSGLHHILLWGDVDNANLEKISKKLNLGNNYYVEILDDPIEILTKNLSEIYSIILIVTDCTKLSNGNFALKRLNESLVNYVRKGGKLICTHDVIYRRTRNTVLQELFGCRISCFRQEENVHYVKTQQCMDNAAFNNLPETFCLHDAEICWGDIADDVDVYFTTVEGIPLVFSREYGEGICIYLNSGDFKDRPPLSIRKPEKEFISLLQGAIQMEY